jgi:hypothetical protein
MIKILFSLNLHNFGYSISFDYYTALKLVSENMDAVAWELSQQWGRETGSKYKQM